jgi:hypothetical protein
MDGRRIAKIRVRPEHQTIDDAEHRDVGADAERERDDRSRRESG